MAAMTELILGTAEFGPAAYGEGVKKPLSDSEICDILSYAFWFSGIKTLDTSDQYGTERIDWFFGAFKRLFKSRKDPKAFYHYKELERPKKGLKRASVYTLAQLKGLKEAIVPINPNNLTFVGEKMPPVWYARSVFDRGRALKRFSVFQCLLFASVYEPKGIIVGVNSLQELKEIVKAWEKVKALGL